MRPVLAITLVAFCATTSSAAPILLGAHDNDLGFGFGPSPDPITAVAFSFGYDLAVSQPAFIATSVGDDVLLPLEWTGTMDFSGADLPSVSARLTNGANEPVCFGQTAFGASTSRGPGGGCQSESAIFGTVGERSPWDVEFIRLIVTRHEVVLNDSDFFPIDGDLRWEIWGEIRDTPPDPDPEPVPEPGVLALLAAAMGAVAARRSR